jgi:hypothetical protein
MSDHDRSMRGGPPAEKEFGDEQTTRNRQVGGAHRSRQDASTFGSASQKLHRTARTGFAWERYRLPIVVLAGALVMAALAVFGLEHRPDYSIGFLSSSRTVALRLKSETATAVLGMGLFQLLLALWMWGRLPGMGTAPRRVGAAHRAIGIVLFLATLPVAAHCLLAYGVRTSSVRATVHSLAGCFFYGAFATKVLVVRSGSLPSLVLPVAGGLLATAIGVLWYTSALWFFNGYRLPLG